MDVNDLLADPTNQKFVDATRAPANADNYSRSGGGFTASVDGEPEPANDRNVQPVPDKAPEPARTKPEQVTIIGSPDMIKAEPEPTPAPAPTATGTAPPAGDKVEEPPRVLLEDHIKLRRRASAAEEALVASQSELHRQRQELESIRSQAEILRANEAAAAKRAAELEADAKKARLLERKLQAARPILAKVNEDGLVYDESAIEREAKSEEAIEKMANLETLIRSSVREEIGTRDARLDASQKAAQDEQVRQAYIDHFNAEFAKLEREVPNISRFRQAIALEWAQDPRQPVVGIAQPIVEALKPHTPVPDPVPKNPAGVTSVTPIPGGGSAPAAPPNTTDPFAASSFKGLGIREVQARLHALRKEGILRA